MDVESWKRWWHYTGAYHGMLEAADTSWAPWVRMPADDTRRARFYGSCSTRKPSLFSSSINISALPLKISQSSSG